ncbi:GNAT family N-acetyltransferase [Lentzea sp. NPDC042327]|uniref:GNAT family N-acetyltransferase n=1 Tax=Lentzea sp. NPDC042327 TaxID=3154801 RepID=UPI00340CC6FF
MLEIRPLDLDDLDGCVALRIAAQTVDDPAGPVPDGERIARGLRNPRVEHGEVVHRIAVRDGVVVAAASVALPPDENAKIAAGGIEVHPRHRGQGVGTEVLEALLAELCARDRETFENLWVPRGSAGEKWAVARGFTVGAHRLWQELRIADVDPALWDVPVPDGYRVQQWTNATPEHLLASVATTRQSIADAPAEGIVLVAPAWTPEQVRAKEALSRAAGVEQRIVVAVHGDEVVALTEMSLYPSNLTSVYQEDTVVVPAHRGRGLGRVVKAHMLRWLLADRPGLELVETQTNADNVHMIRVNHRLGFVDAREVVTVSRPC